LKLTVDHYSTYSMPLSMVGVQNCGKELFTKFVNFLKSEKLLEKVIKDIIFFYRTFRCPL